MDATYRSGNKLKIWELALLIALCVSLCTGLTSHAAQQELASQVVRLHIIAQSDSEQDQKIKLDVRDAVLDILTPALAETQDMDEAQEIISDRLPELEAAAEAALLAGGTPASAQAVLSVENYPLRVYDGFSLPAGDYVSLRIVLGEGEGHNWWCVVFPPLCMAAAEDEDAFSRLSDEAARLIVPDEDGYILKFRIIELYEKIRAALT